MRLPTRLTVFLSALLLASAVVAAPSDSPEDNARLFEARDLMVHLDQVRQNVGQQASSLVDTAMSFLGVRYRRGGSSVETGFDCSGLVRTIYEQTAGLLLPRRAEQQAAATVRIDRKDLQPGDLVFFNTMRRAFSHVGIYIGDGKFIHSPRTGEEVRVESMSLSYWARRFDGARRVVSDAETP